MKKRYLMMLLLVIIGIITGIWFFRKPPHNGPTPDEIVIELLEFDRNRDGQLSKEELSERMQGLFVRGDDNHDGVLDQAELRKLATAQYESAQRSQRGGRRE